MDDLLKNNKLIAEFMGYKNSLESKDPEYCRWYHPDNLGLMFFIEEFRYNESWNWLMPVVEKIESLGWFINIHSKNECTWTSDYDNDSTIDRTFCTMNSKLDTIYLTVVTFIKWYNENNKK